LKVVEGVRSGNRPRRDDLVAALYDRHRSELIRLGIGLVGDVGDAEELVQDAFAALLRRWTALRDVDAAPGYLRTAVVNGARARWRRRALRERMSRLIGVPTETTDPDVAERSTLLTAIAALPVRKRACVLLRYYADLSEAETATVLGVSVGTVKSQTAKALAQLSKSLESQQSGAQQ
jgi:RNA polymerase sigma-70 factor (sigma-E family)